MTIQCPHEGSCYSSAFLRLSEKDLQGVMRLCACIIFACVFRGFVIKAVTLRA